MHVPDGWVVRSLEGADRAQAAGRGSEAPGAEAMDAAMRQLETLGIELEPVSVVEPEAGAVAPSAFSMVVHRVRARSTASLDLYGAALRRHAGAAPTDPGLQTLLWGSRVEPSSPGERGHTIVHLLRRERGTRGRVALQFGAVLPGDLATDVDTQLGASLARTVASTASWVMA